MEASQIKVVHIYQNTIGGNLLFYTVSDFLVFFTIFCREARRWKVRVIGVCPMYDHLHILVECEDKRRLYRFVQAYTRQYAEAFNLSIGSSGAIFNEHFGRAERTGLKEVRSACSYLYNNPGEKNLCRRAEDYRWTFLAYAVSKNPFSEPIVLSKTGFRLRNAVKMVDYYRKHDKPLQYKWLTDMTAKLTRPEIQQLTDYIISSYNCIDYDRLISFYGSYSQVCLAFASNQGKEFGFKEAYSPGNHMEFIHIGNLLTRTLGVANVKDIFKMPAPEKERLAGLCFKMTTATKRQIAKYFRGVQAPDNLRDTRNLSPKF